MKKKKYKDSFTEETSYASNFGEVGDEPYIPSASGPIKQKTNNIIYNRFMGRPKLKWVIAEEEDNKPDKETLFTELLELLLSVDIETLSTYTAVKMIGFFDLLELVAGEEEDNTNEGKLSVGASPAKRRYAGKYYRDHKTRIRKRRAELAKKKKRQLFSKDKRSKTNKGKTYRNTAGTEMRKKRKTEYERKKDKTRTIKDGFYGYVENERIKSKVAVQDLTEELKKGKGW